MRLMIDSIVDLRKMENFEAYNYAIKAPQFFGEVTNSKPVCTWKKLPNNTQPKGILYALKYFIKNSSVRTDEACMLNFDGDSFPCSIHTMRVLKTLIASNISVSKDYLEIVTAYTYELLGTPDAVPIVQGTNKLQNTIIEQLNEILQEFYDDNNIKTDKVIIQEDNSLLGVTSRLGG